MFVSRLNGAARVVACGLLLTVALPLVRAAEGPYFATGIKIGEVTDDSAIVWTRLTRNAERNPSDGPLVKIEYEKSAATKSARRTRTVKAIEFSEGTTAADLREGAPGVDGDVRVLWKAEKAEQWQSTDWQKVAPLNDFTRQFALEELEPATRYEVRVESRGIDGAGGRDRVGPFPHGSQSR